MRSRGLLDSKGVEDDESDDESNKGHGRHRLTALHYATLAASLALFIIFAEEIGELIHEVRKPVVSRFGRGIETPGTIITTQEKKLGTHDDAGERKRENEGGGRGSGSRSTQAGANVSRREGAGERDITRDSHSVADTLRTELQTLREEHDYVKSKHSHVLIEMESLRAQLAQLHSSTTPEASTASADGEKTADVEATKGVEVSEDKQTRRRWPSVDAGTDDWPGWEPVPSPTEVFGADFPPAEPFKGDEEGAEACTDWSAACTSPVGTVAAYLGGDAEDIAELKRAAATRSFRGEIIVFGTTADELYAQYAHALISNLEDLGLRHHMAITTEETHCAKLKVAMEETQAGKSLGCVWSSFLDHSKIMYNTDDDDDTRRPAASFEEYKQWRVVSNLIHVGYNVLVVDTDVRFLTNPYVFLKNPAILGKHTLITQAEKEGSAYPFNVGLLYVQNATVSGPVRTVFSEMVRRYQLFVHLNESGWRAYRPTVMREREDGGGSPPLHYLLEPGWRELYKYVDFEESLATVDDDGYRVRYGVRDAVWDQAVFNDAVESVVEGHVTYTRTLGRSVRSDLVDIDVWERKHLGMVRVSPSSPSLGGGGGGGEWIVPAERIKPDVGPAEVGEAGLVARLNNRHKLPTRVRLSQVAEMIESKQKAKDHDDNGDDDNEDDDEPKLSFRAISVRNSAATETVVQAPGWLVSGWTSMFGGVEEETGAWGFWNLPKDEHPTTAVAHVVGVGESKAHIMMAYGWWAPTVSPDLRGRLFVTVGSPLKPVRTENMADFYELLTRLVAVAVQADAVAVVPLVDCASPWILKNHSKTWMGVVPITHQSANTLVIPTRCPFSAVGLSSSGSKMRRRRRGAAPGERREEQERVEHEDTVCCHFIPRDVACMARNERLGSRRMITIGEFLVGKKRESLSMESSSSTVTLNVDDDDALVASGNHHHASEKANIKNKNDANITTATVAAAVVAKAREKLVSATTSSSSVEGINVVLEGGKDVTELLPPVGFADARANNEWLIFNRFPICQLKQMKEEASEEKHQSIPSEWHNRTAREYRLPMNALKKEIRDDPPRDAKKQGRLEEVVGNARRGEEGAGGGKKKIRRTTNGVVAGGRGASYAHRMTLHRKMSLLKHRRRRERGGGGGAGG